MAVLLTTSESSSKGRPNERIFTSCSSVFEAKTTSIDLEHVFEKTWQLVRLVASLGSIFAERFACDG